MAQLSAHWRVVGALVERNVLVTVPRGITIGDNYSLVPRDCTVQDNLVVAATTAAAIVQRVAPSNTVLVRNQYYATTTAAGMTQDADTIWRKPGFGPRLTYLELSEAGPAADLSDTDGTGAEVGGGTEIPAPADVLDIGPEDDQNHFQLQYAVNGSTGNNWTLAEFEELAEGFSADPYFKTVTRTIDGVVVPVVHFQVRADAATTTGSSFPRSELRETRADGSEMAFDAMVGEHSLRTKVRITHLPTADPEVVVAQLHNGSSDRISVRTQLTSSQTKLLVRINGTQADPRLSEQYAVDDEFEIEIKVLDGGLVEVYYQGSTSPLVTGQLVSTGSASWFWKAGAYAQFDGTSAGSSTEYVSVEHRDLRVTHGGFRVDAGVDATVVKGQPFTRAAQELGLTGVTTRRWTIVSQPATPPGGGNGGGVPDPTDLTVAAIRHNWGNSHPLSDEFNYVGAPNSTKWSLPGEGWAGHSGNGRRRPERQTVDGEKLIMTGLANGDSGWMRHKLDQQYGRWEARVRSFETGSTGSGRYHPLLLLWPTSNSRQQDGEYDYMENNVPGDTKLGAFMHFPHPGTTVVQQRHFEKLGVNLSEWHNIGFEWTSAHLKGFLDGVEWFVTSGGANDVRRNIQTMPSGHGNIQLDNFTGTSGLRPASLEVAWYRVYSL